MSDSVRQPLAWQRSLATVRKVAVVVFVRTVLWGAAYQVVAERMAEDLHCDDFGPCPPWEERSPYFFIYALLAFTLLLPYHAVTVPGVIAVTSLELGAGESMLSIEWLIVLAINAVLWSIVLCAWWSLARPPRHRRRAA